MTLTDVGIKIKMCPESSVFFSENYLNMNGDVLH